MNKEIPGEQAVLERVKKDGIRIIELQFTDVFGVIKSVSIPTNQLKSILEHGVGFDGSSIEGFARIQESDLILKPDLGTYTVFPWSPREHPEARFICDVFTHDDKTYDGSPRSRLRIITEKAREMGYIFNVGTEQEFDMFPREIIENPALLSTMYDGYKNYYFTFTTGTGIEIRRDMMNALNAMGMEVEMGHHEVAPKQHEIDIRYSDALHHADDAITFRYVVKTIAHMHNHHATFMPKTRFGVNGVGMHTHQSLSDLRGNNLFYDPNDKYNLSQKAYYFMGGLMEHIRSMTAITNPIVNSYKRLTPGYEAACYICWARANRSALIRVPLVPNGRAKNSTRIELRSPDPSCNPYLAFSVMLAAGLDGIKRKIQPYEPVEEDVYKLKIGDLLQRNIPMLPSTLKEAIGEMEKDKLIKETLGDHVYRSFLNGANEEWDNFRLAVTDWEIDRYFKSI